MLRPGFGLVDAPRAWSLEFCRALAENHFYPTTVDPQLFNRHNATSGALEGQLSDHVDDVKGCCDPSVQKSLLADLERRYGKL